MPSGMLSRAIRTGTIELRTAMSRRPKSLRITVCLLVGGMFLLSEAWSIAGRIYKRRMHSNQVAAFVDFSDIQFRLRSDDVETASVFDSDGVLIARLRKQQLDEFNDLIQSATRIRPGNNPTVDEFLVRLEFGGQAEEFSLILRENNELDLYFTVKNSIQYAEGCVVNYAQDNQEYLSQNGMSWFYRCPGIREYIQQKADAPQEGQSFREIRHAVKVQGIRDSWGD